MNKITILSLMLMGLLDATEYQLVHLKKGGTLNVREVPIVESKTVVGRIPVNGTGIRIKRCKYNESGDEWCYITYPLGGDHLEGWVKRYFLEPMKENTTSKLYITNFLTNYYMADEENFLDKLQVFYSFPMQQYFRKKNISLMQLRSKKVSYYKQWPRRHYQLTYMKILKRNENYIDVQTTVKWRLKGREDEESGKDIQKLRLLPMGNTFKVSALKNLKHTVFPKPKPKPIEELNTTVPKVLVTQSVTTPKTTSVTTSNIPSVTPNHVRRKKYYIKAGSFFGTIDNGYLSKITNNGFAYMVQKAKQKETVLRRVYIGPFASSEEAKQALGTVRSTINANAYIQSLNN